MKYNLGCGDKKLNGYVNVDISAECKPDIVADITKTPWEWAKEAERYEMDNLAEHIANKDLIKVINECHKTLNQNGTLFIRVPELREGNLMACFSDPTHINYFTDQTFQYFVENEGRYRWFGKDYGIMPWKRLEQKKHSVFLDVTLIK